MTKRRGVMAGLVRGLALVVWTLTALSARVVAAQASQAARSGLSDQATVEYIGPVMLRIGMPQDSAIAALRRQYDVTVSDSFYFGPTAAGERISVFSRDPARRRVGVLQAGSGRIYEIGVDWIPPDANGFALGQSLLDAMQRMTSRDSTYSTGDIGVSSAASCSVELKTVRIPGAHGDFGTVTCGLRRVEIEVSQVPGAGAGYVSLTYFLSYGKCVALPGNAWKC